MGKIIFWLVIIFAVLLVLRIVNVAQNRPRRDATRARRAPQQDAMIRCVDCGIYLPSADVQAGPRGPLCGDPQCVRRASKREE